MTDPSSGIRFDIYERVHLPDDAAAIEELEEIELVPHMQALKQAEQTVLKGHLLLTGVYRSTDRGQTSERLEHWIPVEITLPPDRVQREDDLAVEIDNFDVDLLSTRSLNVTGVLALRGIHASQTQQPVWRDDSFTVVHQVQAEDEKQAEQELQVEQKKQAYQELQTNQEIQFEQKKQTEQELQTNQKKQAKQELSTYQRTQAEQALLQTEQDEWQQSDTGVSSASEGGGLTQTSGEEDEANLPLQGGRTGDSPSAELPDNSVAAVEWGDLTANAAQPNLEQIIKDEQPAENAPDKKDLKIAFGVTSNHAETASPAVELLSKMGAGRSAAELLPPALQTAAENQAEAAEQDQSQSQSATEKASTGDELEWTRLFLNEASGADPFCKLKMCIVQREDTLEDIAARYNVQMRELQLHNSLHDPHVSEGQVLYIPQ